MLKRLLCTLAIFAVSIASGSARAGNFALIVGINQYEYAGDLPNLRYARPDAETIAGLLKNASSFPPGCIRLIVDSQATRDAILRAFADLERACYDKGGPADHALVFFAGHAVDAGASKGDFVKGNGAQSREFLAPYDANPEDVYALADGSYENSTFIKKEEFSAQLSHLSEQNISLIIDACHSDIPDLGQVMRLQLLGTDKRVGLLAASNEDAEAYEFPELHHGALSYAIIRTLFALREETPRDQLVDETMDKLYQSVMTLFSVTKVRGKRLIDYNRPALEMYPSGTRGIRFAALTGIGALPAAPTIAVASRERPSNVAPPPQPEREAAPPAPLSPSTTVFEPPPAVAVASVSPPAPLPPPTGAVEFASAIPSDAYLEVNGSRVSWTPGRRILLPAGSYILVVGQPDFTYRSVHRVDVPPGGTVPIEPAFVGSLAIRSVEKAHPTQLGPPLRIVLDGQSLGTGNNMQWSNIAAGTHQLSVTVHDTTKVTQVTIEPDSPLLVRYLAQAVAPPARTSNVIPL
ncbi:MAG: caspase family protein [Pseudomonadota bacterium]|nr:caspase family protein [Pseudomonadota bacterium]